MSNGSTFQIGVDIGGTNTDFVVLTDDGELRTHKVPTTPSDYPKGVLAGLQDIAADVNRVVSELLDDTRLFVHGTTVTTNAILENTEAPTGLLTTDGFRDVLEFNVESHPEVYRLDKQNNIVTPRHRRKSLHERIDKEGNVNIPLDDDDVKRALDSLVDDGIEAIGVALMSSYQNDDHERRVKEICNDVEGIEAVSISQEVLPSIGLYNRSVAAAVDASLKPVLRKYLNEFDEMLQSNGFEGTLLIMQGNGGVSSVDVMANEKAIMSVNSGPAAGAIASGYTAGLIGIEGVISLDMGGTSCDVSLLRQGRPMTTSKTEAGDVPIPVSMADISTISAGGGSVAWIDDRGIIRLGPMSAGSDPGPICYDNGGERPTTTDATLILGYLNPDNFLGGSTTLDLEKSREGVKSRLGDPLQLSVEETAKAVYALANEKMYNQIRQVSVQRGYDPRDFVLIAAGGAGPVHAAELGSRLGTEVIIPGTAGTLSALGLLCSDIKHDYVESIAEPLDGECLSEIEAAFRAMEKGARDTLAEEGFPETAWEFEYYLDTRYDGQVYDVEIQVDRNELDKVETIETLHHAKHEELYTFSDRQSQIRVINARVSAIATTDDISVPVLENPVDPDKALKTHREALFPDSDGYVETPIYDGEQAMTGQIAGPVIVEQNHTTVVVPPSSTLRIDNHGNYIIDPTNP